MALLGLAPGCRGGTHASPRPPSSETPASDGTFVSGMKTKVFHLRECLYARDIPDRDLRTYASAEEAALDGKIPCAICHPNASTRPGTAERAPARTQENLPVSSSPSTPLP